MKLKRMHWAGIIAAGIILVLDLVFFFDNQKMMLFIMGIALGAVALPFIIGIGLQSQKDQKINEMFLEMSRNLAESVSAGTPISKSLVNMQKKNYGVLNPHVSKLANQIELGIPVGQAFETFAEDIDSVVVKRAVALIKEAGRAGGEIDYILDSTAKSISEIEKLKKERKSAIYNLVVQGYIIFFIFIGIVLVMEFKIVPLTADVGGIVSLSGDISNFDKQETPAALDPESLTRPFLYLLLTQGLFVGLTIGKLTEGTIKSGLKHSFILMITSFLISTGSRLFIG